MALRSIQQLKIKEGTRVLIRVDFDVALLRGAVKDDFRIREALPSIRYVLRRGGRVRLIAHLKRPHGKIIPALSLRPIAFHLEKIAGRRVFLIKDPLRRESFEKYNGSSGILLFENVRFWKGEEKNSVSFASRLARWGDCYVNDAFANSHRLHASMVAIARLLPSSAGLHLAGEVDSLGKILQHPQRPIVAILGGAKLETKLPLIEKCLRGGGEVLLGGALANSLLVKKGVRVGSSFVDREVVSRIAPRVFKSKKLHLPIDGVVAQDKTTKAQVVSIGAVPSGKSIFDVGPSTVKEFLAVLRKGKTILWNGQVGMTEVPSFSWGTIALARGLQKIHAYKVVGGGDLVAFLRQKRLLRSISHVSTGGGAMLEFLSGKKLPAIEVLGK